MRFRRSPAAVLSVVVLLGCERGKKTPDDKPASSASVSAAATSTATGAKNEPPDPLARTELAKLSIASQKGEELGGAIAVSGKRIVVTADHHRTKDGDESTAGRLVIGSWDGANFQIDADIKPTDPQQLGTSVAISSRVVVAGARYADGKVPESGAAFVFELTDGAWSQTAKLVADDGKAKDYFGSAVATTDEVIAVGADARHSGKTGMLQAGGLYVFERTGKVWSQRSVIAGEGDGWLGTSVAISGKTIVSGAPFEDKPGKQSGAAHVYAPTPKGWAEEARLVPDDPRDHANFGESVAIDGNTLVVGAVGLDAKTSAVYVFVNTDRIWKQQTKIEAPPDADAFFAGAVALSGDTLVVGAKFANEKRGCAYLYRRTGTQWTLVGKLGASDAMPNDWFGEQVAASRELIAVGSPLPGDRSGVAYVFAPR